MTMSHISAIVAVVAGLFLSPAAAFAAGNQRWTMEKGADPNAAISFFIVRIHQDAAKERNVYDDAVGTLCEKGPHQPICIIGFYLPGDQTPQSTRYLKWENTTPVAVWWSNENSDVASYTIWDCKRGPEKNVPFTADCGDTPRRLGPQDGKARN